MLLDKIYIYIFFSLLFYKRTETTNTKTKAGNTNGTTGRVLSLFADGQLDGTVLGILGGGVTTKECLFNALHNSRAPQLMEFPTIFHLWLPKRLSDKPAWPYKYNRIVVLTCREGSV